MKKRKERKKDKEIEEYLLEIENKSTTDKLTQLQKKIAREFEKEEAYKILRNCEFDVNKGNDEKKTEQSTEKTIAKIVQEMFKKETSYNISIKLSNGIKLTEKQQEILQKQISLVYEISEIQYERAYEKEEKKEVNSQKEKSQEITADWDRIRKKIVRQIDGTVDKWLSKLEAEEDKLTRTLKLRTSNSYIKERVEKEYGSYIEKYAMEVGYEEIAIVNY